MKRHHIITLAFWVCILTAGYAYAGIGGLITTALAGSTLSIVGWALGAIVVVINKVIPNDKMQAFFFGLGKGVGVTVTLGMSSWKWTKGFWNKTIEPYFVDLLNNIPVAFINGIIAGLKTDNPGGAGNGS